MFLLLQCMINRIIESYKKSENKKKMKKGEKNERRTKA